jgi:hypothetical protein
VGVVYTACVRTMYIRKDVLMCPHKGTECVSAKDVLCPRRTRFVHKGRSVLTRRTVSVKDTLYLTTGLVSKVANKNLCVLWLRHCDHRLSRRFQRSPTTCVNLCVTRNRTNGFVCEEGQSVVREKDEVL